MPTKKGAKKPTQQRAGLKEGDLLDIKAHRKRVGMTQAQLAKKMNVTQSAVSWWESGRWEPCRKYHKKLAKIFGITVDELTGGSEGEEKRTIS